MGQEGEVEDFVDSYLKSQGQALRSRIFRDYLVLSIRFTAIAFVENLGYSAQDLLENTYTEKMQVLSLSLEEMKPYMQELMYRAIKLGCMAMDNRGKRMIQKARGYIEENYARASISLNEAARAAEVSPNYFSATFRQEMGNTAAARKAKSLANAPVSKAKECSGCPQTQAFAVYSKRGSTG